VCPGTRRGAVGSGRGPESGVGVGGLEQHVGLGAGVVLTSGVDEVGIDPPGVSCVGEHDEEDVLPLVHAALRRDRGIGAGDALLDAGRDVRRVQDGRVLAVALDADLTFRGERGGCPGRAGDEFRDVGRQ